MVEHTTISRAQREVWDWKEAAYREVERLPRRDALRALLRNAEDVTQAAGIHLERMPPLHAAMSVAERQAAYGRKDDDAENRKT